MNVTEKLRFVLERREHIVGKKGNACYQHFLLFPQCFQKASQGRQKSELCGKVLNEITRHSVRTSLGFSLDRPNFCQPCPAVRFYSK